MRSNNIKFTIFVWLGLALLFTLIVHLLSYRYIRELTWTNKQISQSYQVLKTAEELYRVVLDIESSGRGFSITGDRSFLLTFEQNFRRTEQLLNDLEAFKAYNPTLKSRISQLRSLVEEKLNFGREVVESTLTKGTEFSQELIAGGRGQALSNRILALVSFFRENENRLLIEHTRRSEDIEDNVFIVVMVSGILAILIVLLAVIFIFRDLNKRKELEDELKENESRISQFLEAVPVGVYVVDNKGRPYYANKQSQHLLGRGIVPNARMDEYPEIYRAYIEGTDERYPVDKMPIVQALKGVTSTEDDIEVRTGEHIRLLEISACPIFDLEGNVNYAIASFIDITQRKETEKLLKRARSMAEESARIKESFLANMSHEIRTPMNAIIGFSELLEKTRLDKEQLQFVKAIRNSGENLLVIINDILDFSKIESGMMRLEKVSFSLHSLLHSVENLLKIKSGEKKLELLINYFPDTPDIVEGDPTRLTQILINLIGNAIKSRYSSKEKRRTFATYISG
jgi:CHASE3 domain sensor protein/nitrogen-specific signal transduction histidine kinase